MPDITIQPGIYQYKGKFYSVLGVVRHSETGELMVLYIPLYLVNEDTVPTQMSVRPWKDFMQKFVMVH
jgi:hypothetical protein